MIEIRNGCKPLESIPALPVDTWVYEDAKSTGILRYSFMTPKGVIPKIGDFINEDTWEWVQRTEPKIVPDLVSKYPDDDHELIFRR